MIFVWECLRSERGFAQLILENTIKKKTNSCNLPKNTLSDNAEIITKRQSCFSERQLESHRFWTLTFAIVIIYFHFSLTQPSNFPYGIP